MVHKKHLNQTKSRHTDEVNDTPVDVELMEVLFDTYIWCTQGTTGGVMVSKVD